MLVGVYCTYREPDDAFALLPKLALPRAPAGRTAALPLEIWAPWAGLVPAADHRCFPSLPLALAQPGVPGVPGVPGTPVVSYASYYGCRDRGWKGSLALLSPSPG